MSRSDKQAAAGQACSLSKWRYTTGETRATVLVMFRLVQCSLWCLTLALLVSGCRPSAMRTRVEPALPRAGPSADLVIANGAVMIAGYAGEVGSIVLRRGDRDLLHIVELGSAALTQGSDTLDASGLFVHSGSAFTPPGEVKAGQPALLLLRSGPSPADSIVMSIGYSGPSPFRLFARSDNRPEGDPHPAVGCYHVDRSAWNDPGAAASLPRVVVPETVQLHWQYAGLLGREQLLVATDGEGRIPGEHTVYYFWRPGTADSVTLVFGTGHQQASFRLVQQGADLTGVVRKSNDTSPGPRADASVTFRRSRCL
jgi:hypothetical protein